MRAFSVVLAALLVSSPALGGEVDRNWGGALSVNLPHPVFLDGTYRYSPKWSFSLGLGGLSVPFKMKNGGDANISITALDARARWHPWEGSFFLGAIVGVQKFGGSVTQDIPITLDTGSGTQTIPLDTRITADIVSLYLTPHLGWQWIFKNGLLLGLEVGVQVPVGPKTTLGVETDNPLTNVALAVVQTTQQYKDLDASLQDVGKKIGTIPLPYFTALRVGYMF
jgi:hypothetical protein